MGITKDEVTALRKNNNVASNYSEYQCYYCCHSLYSDTFASDMTLFLKLSIETPRNAFRSLQLIHRKNAQNTYWKFDQSIWEELTLIKQSL